jgi:hypothetical protein
VQATRGGFEQAAKLLVAIEGAAIYLVAGVGQGERHPAFDVVAVERETVGGEEIDNGDVILGSGKHDVLSGLGAVVGGTRNG